MATPRSSSKRKRDKATEEYTNPAHVCVRGVKLDVARFVSCSVDRCVCQRPGCAYVTIAAAKPHAGHQSSSHGSCRAESELNG